MLHEINFCDWRSARKKARYHHWGCALLTGCCVLSAIEWMVWQDYQTGLQHWQWQQARTRSSLTDIRQQLDQWQQRARQQQILRTDSDVRTSWLDASQRPYQVMQMIQQTLPAGVYLDSLTLTDSTLLITGLVTDQGSAALFAANLHSSPFVQNIDQFRIDTPVTRWQQWFHPFELRIEMQTWQRQEGDNE